MQKLKAACARGAVVVGGVLMAGSAMATTVIDTATKTAISAGFTDMKDTLLDILGTAFPFIIGASVILLSPRIVKGMLKMAGK